MVMNDEGQLYTIEGITAGVIMLVTAFTIFNSGLIYTPGDAHISDMQIQQLGYDALLMMDTPDNFAPLSASPLAVMIQENKKTDFGTAFSDYLSKKTGITNISDLEYNATVYSRFASEPEPRSHAFSHSTNSSVSQLTREPAISVTRYVWVNMPNPPPSNYDKGQQLVLLEVLIWRR